MTSRDLPSDLLAPWQLGAFSLSHRVVMPAFALGLSRPVGVPTPAMVRFYVQHSTPGGLVVCEAASVSADVARTDVPGLYNSEQVNHWRLVTDAVHEAGGTVVAHLGLDGEMERVLREGMQDLDEDSMERFLLDYRSTAENAGDAGFDGVELQVAHGALPQRLLHGELPSCASTYRGGVEARFRFLEEALSALVGVWGQHRVGLCLAPLRPVDGRCFDGLDALTFYARLMQQVSIIGIAWLHIVERAQDAASASQALPRMSTLLRPHFSGALVTSGGLDVPSAVDELRTGRAQGVGFDRTHLAEVNLVARLLDELRHRGD